jgi:hypothetical protein
LWKCERNVGEYNTIDLVKDNTKKIYFVPSFEMQEAIMYYSSPGAI